MKLSLILAIINFKSKFSFYEKFFSLKSKKLCYILYVIKELLSFIITSIFIYLFLSRIDILGLNHSIVKMLILLVIYANLATSNKTNVEFLRHNMDIYRLNSHSFIDFLLFTILPIFIVELLLAASSLIPIILGSIIWDRQMAIYILIILVLSFVAKIGYVINKDDGYVESRFSIFIKFFKLIFMIVLIYLLVNLAFSVVGETINIIKEIISNKYYDEDLLLKQLLLSFSEPINTYKYILVQNRFICVFFVLAFILADIINNFIRYKNVWLNKVKMLDFASSAQNDLKKVSDNFFLIKRIHKSSLVKLPSQILKIPEIVVLFFIELKMLNSQFDDLLKVLLIVWFFYIANANFIRSYYILLDNEFTNYDIKTDVYYSKLASRPILDVYNDRIECLNSYTKNMLYVDIILHVILAIYFINSRFLILLTLIFIILIGAAMQKYNCKLATFSRFLNFAVSSKANSISYESQEISIVDEKLHNIFKLPFIIIPMIILLVAYIVDFLNIYLLCLILVLFYALAYFLGKQMDLAIRKGGNILEKINVIG